MRGKNPCPDQPISSFNLCFPLKFSVTSVTILPSSSERKTAFFKSRNRISVVVEHSLYSTCYFHYSGITAFPFLCSKISSCRILESNIKNTVNIFSETSRQGREEKSLCFSGTDAEAAHALLSFLIGTQIVARAQGGAGNFQEVN